MAGDRWQGAVSRVQVAFGPTFLGPTERAGPSADSKGGMGKT